MAQIYGGVTGDQIREVLHHFSEMLRYDLIVNIPAVPGSRQTKTIGELEAEYPGKHLAILDGELLGVCDTWEETRELVNSANPPAGQHPNGQDETAA